MYKNYILFWKTLIVTTLICGAVSLFWAGKNYYAKDLLSFKKTQDAIKGLQLLDSKLFFSSIDSGCQYEVDIDKTVQIEEVVKHIKSVDAEIMYVEQDCIEPIEAVYLNLQEYQFGSYDNFIEKKQNTGAVYFFFSAICLGISLLSLIMLKVTRWLFKRQSAI